MSMNLVEAIQAECNRVRDIIVDYKALPGGVGNFAATWMAELVRQSEKAIASQDAIECVRCFKALKEVQH